MRLSDLLMPRKKKMTIQRAKEILEENEYYIVEIGCGIFAVTYDNETNVVGEQQIIDWARELEDEE